MPFREGVGRPAGPVLPAANPHAGIATMPRSARFGFNSLGLLSGLDYRQVRILPSALYKCMNGTYLLDGAFFKSFFGASKMQHSCVLIQRHVFCVVNSNGIEEGILMFYLEQCIAVPI